MQIGSVGNGGMQVLKNAKAKGSRREREVRDIFLAKGYDVIKGGGSLGAFDLVCVSKTNQFQAGAFVPNVIFIQVKSNRIGNDELCTIGGHETTAEKQVWIKKDREPWMMAVIEDGHETDKTIGRVMG